MTVVAVTVSSFLCIIARTVCCQDPHGELQGQNVLIVRYSVELTAAHFGVSVEKVNELLASVRARMAEVRKGRPRPHLDTKMLASWNGKCQDRLSGREYTAPNNIIPLDSGLRK